MKDMEAKVKPLDYVIYNDKTCQILSLTKRKAVIHNGQYTIKVWIKDIIKITAK